MLAILVPTSLADPAALFAAVAQAATDADKPVLLVASDAPDHDRPAGVTVYRTAEAAVGALARTMRYAAWRRVPADEPPVGLGIRAGFARAWASEPARSPRGSGRVVAGRCEQRSCWRRTAST